MMDAILWDNATRDYDAEQHTAQLERARVALAETVPFIVKAASHDEYLDRIALMQDKIEATLRGLASSEAEYVGLFGAVMSSLDEDFNTLRQARRVKAEAEMDAKVSEDDSDAPEASEDADEASDDEDESDEDEESDEEAEDESEAAAEPDDDEDEDEPEAADKKESRRLSALRQSDAAAGWDNHKDLGFSSKTVRRDGDPYGGLELSIDHMPDDGAYWWYVHDRTDNPNALESGTAPSITAAKWAAERAAEELSSSASRKRASRKTGVRVRVGGMLSDEGTVIIMRGNAMELGDDGDWYHGTSQVTFAADHRNAQMMLDALDAGEPVETDVPSWAVLSRGASRKRASRKVARADFWDAIDAQIEELRSAKSADDVINILSFDRNPYGPEPESGDAFFAGSGGDKTVWGALMNAGWKFVAEEGDYFWVMRAPDGSEITYIEGDIYRGNRMSKSSARRPNRKRQANLYSEWKIDLSSGYGEDYHKTFRVGPETELVATVGQDLEGIGKSSPWFWHIFLDSPSGVEFVASGQQPWLHMAKDAVDAALELHAPQYANQSVSEHGTDWLFSKGSSKRAVRKTFDEWNREETKRLIDRDGPSFAQNIRRARDGGMGRMMLWDDYMSAAEEQGFEPETSMFASRRKRASDMAHGGAAPVRYVAVDEDGVRRLVSTDRIPARWRSYDWTVWAEYADGSSSRVTGPAPTASRRRANRKTAMNFDNAFPAGHVAKNLFDRNGDPIVFHTQTYQILGSPGSRYQVIGLQTREHSMQMMGSEANLVLSEDGATPARTSGGMLGGQFNVIPVPSSKASRRKRAVIDWATHMDTYKGEHDGWAIYWYEGNPDDAWMSRPGAPLSGDPYWWAEKDGTRLSKPTKRDLLRALDDYDTAKQARRKSATRKTARKDVKGIAIYPDKRVEEVTISSLSDYQSIVGGLIEPVMLSDGSTLYVNEEGMYLFGPDDFNSIATDVAGLGGASHILMTGILGPAVLVGPVSNDGYDTDVTSAARAWVNRVAREASVKRRGSRRRAALVSLTNVGIDRETGNGVGTDPSGNRVQFKITDEERDQLKQVLYSDLAVNFSGVDVDESDIIKEASRRTAANKMYEVEVEGHEEYLDEDLEEIDPDSYNTEVVYVLAPNEDAAAEAAEEWLSVTLFEPQMVSVRETSDSVSPDVTLNPDGTWRTTAGYKPKKSKKHARRRTAYFDYTVNPTGDENYNYDEYLRGRADGYDDGYDVGSNKPNAKDRRNEWDMDPKNDYQVGYGFGFSEGVQRGVDERYPVMQPDWFDPADAGERWSDDY